MLYEVKVVCRFCSHEFWSLVEADTQRTPDEVFEVQCPENDSLIRFRISDRRTPRWDASWAFQATEWRAAKGLGTNYPVARVIEG
jgi:hypothetical protein